MISVGRIFLRVVAAAEVVIFSLYLLCGAHGIRAIKAMQQKNELLVQQIAEKEAEVQATRSQVNDWKKYPYYKEQYAREHLQMARKDDEVYLV